MWVSSSRLAPARLASRPASAASMCPRSLESFEASPSAASHTNRSAPWAKRASRSVGAVSAENTITAAGVAILTE